MSSATTQPATVRHDASGSPDGTYDHRGTLFSELTVPKDQLLAVQEYDDVRQDDVIVWTYPKAGTHWTIDIVAKILQHANPDRPVQGIKGDLCYEIRPAPKIKEQVEKHGLVDKRSAETLHELSEVPSPRVIGTHLLYDMLPQKLQDGKAKLIYVYRDPRDLAVSMWHQNNRIGAALSFPATPWDTFIEQYMQGKVSWGLWSRHFKSCQNLKDREHVFVLFYEQMIQDLKGTVRRVASFLGKELSAENVEAIAASCTFEATKAAKPNLVFVRKGITGDWKEHFTVAQSEEFNAHMIKEVGDLQLGVPYGPF